MPIPRGISGVISKSDFSKLIDKTIKKDTGKKRPSSFGTAMGMAKKGGNIMKSRKGGGTVKKQVGGLPVGYDARLRESLAARHPAVTGNLAERAAESRGMERALGRRPFAAVGTMDRPVKKGGSVRRKKGGTASRGKIFKGYKAGGKV